MGMMTLFIAKAKQGFDFTVDDFEFPALPSPGEQEVNGKRQAPLGIALNRVD